MKQEKPILPLIVFSQFCCTSLWFAGNGIMNDLVKEFSLSPLAVGHLTTAVQLGFIAGTLVFAFLSVADRFLPSRVFVICAILGALFNLGLIFEGNDFESLFLLRLLTGFSLAGIYPVGMKIAADHYEAGLGRSLGFLVGALVLGTAFPHLLKTFAGTGGLPWKTVIYSTSTLAVLGGLLILIWVPPGPYRKAGSGKNYSAFLKVFKQKEFRKAATGYFGHMWELYTFWAFVPVVLTGYNRLNPQIDFNIPLLSFIIIGIGGPACVAGGYLSQIFGVKRTAVTALIISGTCCLLSPLVFYYTSANLVIVFLLVWGLAVVADSPLFSTMVAQHAAPQIRGTALTIVNSIGFGITILSLQVATFLLTTVEIYWMFLFLAIGPAIGGYTLLKKSRSR